MKNWAYHLGILAFCVILLSSCYYDVESELYPYATCNPANTKYASGVLPILQRSCYSCHNQDNATLNGNVKIDSYEDVLQYVQNGMLMGSLRHDVGYVAMPKDAQKISDCELAKIEAWISEGALNN
jgi:hypothetical protein